MAHPPSEVAVIGNIGIDTNVYLPGRDIDWTVESNFTENLDYVGQAGGYASRGYAKLGHSTTFIGYVGDDFAGRQIRAELAQDGIDTTALFLDPTGTSRSVNIMYRDGRRKNFYDGKAHMELRPDLEQVPSGHGRMSPGPLQYPPLGPEAAAPGEGTRPAGGLRSPGCGRSPGCLPQGLHP